MKMLTYWTKVDTLLPMNCNTVAVQVKRNFSSNVGTKQCPTDQGPAQKVEALVTA